VSAVDCLDFRLLGSYIETFADYAVTIAENVQDKLTVPKSEQTLLGNIGNAVNSMYKDAVGAVLSRDLKLASSVAPRFQDIKKQLASAETSVAGTSRPLINHLVATILALNRMSEITVDIADLTITR
jgi:phosphate uptake regulator